MVAATQNPASSDDKNPLDVLEELLKDSGGSGGGGAAGDPPKPELKPGELTDEELAQRREEFEQKKAIQTAEDTQKLAEQQELLKTLTQTPQYQARVQQEADHDAASAKEEEAGEGYEVTQLKHDKI